MTACGQIYRFRQKFAENKFCQTWLAERISDDATCIVKLASDDSGAAPEQTNRILANSYRLQRPLHFPGILRARRSVTADGFVCIEYPYLDPLRWQPLTPEIFSRRVSALFPAICLSVDFLHLQRLVHGDLKLENFLVNQNADEVMLADLDFLCEERSDLDGRIFGTGEHIAPELSADGLITVQSDTYSLGVSLGRFLSDATESRDPASDLLRSHLSRLTDHEHVRRPRVLLDFLAEIKFGSADDLAALEHRLVSGFLLTRLRMSRRSSLGDLEHLDDFIHQECHLLGFHPDAVDQFARSYRRNRIASIDCAVELFGASSIERHSDYWHVRPSLDALTRFYERLECIETGAADSALSEEQLVKRARELSAEGKTEKAALAYRRLLLRPGGSLPETSVSARLDLLIDAGMQALRTGRSTMAREFFEAGLVIAPANSEPRLHILSELTSNYQRAGERERMQACIDEAMSSRITDESRVWQLNIRRLQAWDQMRHGNYESAKSAFLDLIAEADRYDIWQARALARYSLAVMEHRQGNMEQALKWLEEALPIADSRTPRQTFLIITAMLAAVHLDLSEYPLAVRYAEAGIEAARAEHNAGLDNTFYGSLVGSFCRMGMHARAHYCYERVRRSQVGGSVPEWLGGLWVNEAQIWLEEGDLQKAERCLHRAEELRHLPNHNFVSRTLQALMYVSLLQGRLAQARHYLSESQAELERVNDRASLSELNLDALFIAAQEQAEGLGEEIETNVLMLLDADRRALAAHGILQLLLHDEDRGVAMLRRLEPGRLAFLARSGHPLMLAVHSLAIALAKESAFGERAGAWKTAYTILNKAHTLYWAANVALHLGDMYLAEGLAKHARKFFSKGAELARRLPNPLLEARGLNGLARADAAVGDIVSLVGSYVTISEILKDVADFRSSLNRLIRFAVDQTGAERGVLMLRRPDSSRLQIGAAVNCDDQSLNDVLQFSSTLPESAFRDALPIVVEDATTDERTRDYKSVVVHNILSVVCLPLKDGDDTIGVLYLDHHSIPALFDKNDLRYIESIANFLTVFLITAQEVRQLTTAQSELLGDLSRLGVADGFITQDPVMMRMLTQLPQIAATDASILLLGESGTGKELICNMIHRLSLRSKRPFRKINCAAIAAANIESELFGVARNAFTGVAGRPGKLETADEGTLFLDEIGDMPLEVQAKVLRVLEYQEFERVGGNDPVSVDIRFVFATNKDLRKLVAEEKFRQDLLYRINTIVIEVPPLRERVQDIPLLVDYYIKIFCPDRTPPRISTSTMDVLLSYPWPGNAREVRNVIERTCILYAGQRVDPSMLPPEFAAVTPNVLSGKELVERAEAAAIREALVRAKWVQSRAAQLLNMPLTTLRRKIKKYRITPD